MKGRDLMEEDNFRRTSNLCQPSIKVIRCKGLQLVEALHTTSVEGYMRTCPFKGNRNMCFKCEEQGHQVRV